MIIDPNDRSLRMPEPAAGLAVPLAVGGIVALLIAAVVGAIDAFDIGMRYYFHAYLTAYAFCLSISLGALFFVAIQHLTRAGWSASIRRLAELLMILIPFMAILFIPILATLWFGEGVLYPWDGGEIAAELPPAKFHYLNTPFFTIRALVYLGIWSWLSWYYYSLSRRQDGGADPVLTERMQRWSGPTVILFSLSVSFAAFDWLMSLSPMWFSTIFGVYLFSASVLALFAALCVLLYWLRRYDRLKREVTVEHWHDLGKFTFGFVVFWAYIAFSQYMLIWYGNIPEETFWFIARQTEGWTWVSLLLILGHWLVPFLGLLSRHVRRRPPLMFFWGCYLLVMHYIDLYWLVMPETGAGATGGLLGLATSLLCLLGMLGLYLGAFLRLGSQVPLVAVGDPRMPEALAFENV